MLLLSECRGHIQFIIQLFLHFLAETPLSKNRLSLNYETIALP